ncbi:MAG: magnesium transporter, partial [Bauldia litoralis]
MLDAYTLSPGGPKRLDLTDGGPVPEDTRWVDLVHPTPSEDAATEVFLSASLPTREEASEIEFSSRFYSEDGAVFMTATVLTGVDKGEASLVPLTIVVTGDQ